MGIDLLLAIAVGALFGLGLFVAVLAVVGLPERDLGKPPRKGPSLQERSRRVLFGAIVGVITLFLTGWVVAGLGMGLLVAFWDKIGGAASEEQRAIARLDALAAWTESLRDTIAGAIGLEQAIPATATNAAPTIRPSLNLLVDRLRIRDPLPDALRGFAEDLDDPSADVICAALLLNSRLRGPGLRDVLTALAVSTREELDMRRRIEASRKSIRRSSQIVLVIVLGMMGGLAIFNKQYVAPYDSFAGQGVLVVVALLLLVGLMWLRRLSAPAKTERFLVFGEGGATRRPGIDVEAAS